VLFFYTSELIVVVNILMVVSFRVVVSVVIGPIVAS
jgi:hypothetical protein